MVALKQIARNLCKEEYAVTSIEYSLLAGLIVVVIVASVGLLGAEVLALYESVAVAF